MTQKIEKPTPPADDDCCGGGSCTPCVWDFYFKELQKWEISEEMLQNNQG